MSQVYRKNLLSFNYDPHLKQNFQLGRMADILVCEKGDDLLVRSERNVIMNNHGIWNDKYFADSRKNPEFMDIIRLQNVTEYRRYRSKIPEDYNEEEELPFEWTSIDDDQSDDTTKERDPSSPPFVSLSDIDKCSFVFNVPKEEEKIAVLVFATFQVCDYPYDSICLTLERQPQTVAYRAKHSGHFLHINTVVEVAQDEEIGFCGITIPDEGPWEESSEYNDFGPNSSYNDNLQSVAFIKLASNL